MHSILSSRQAAIFGLLAVLFAAVLWTAWLCDDAFITARSVDNLLNGHGFRWNVADRVQVYTHPLWAGLMIPAQALIPDGWTALMVLSVAAAAASLAAGWLATAGQPSPALTFGALVGCKGFVEYSTSGLENPLTHALLALGVAAALAPRPQVVALGAVVGLMAVNRLDSVAMLAPTLAWASWEHRSDLRSLAVAAAAAAGPWLAWSTFAWVYYGSILPNTAYAKLGMGMDRAEVLGQGLTYLQVSLAQDPASFVVLVAGLGLGLRARFAPGAAISAGALSQVAWTVWVGGDFMEGRFLTGPVWLAALMLAWTVVPRPGWVAALAAVGGTVLTPESAFRTGPGFGGAGGAAYGDRLTPLVAGIADERHYYFPATSLIGRPWRDRPVDHVWLDEIPGLRAAPYTMTVGSVGFVGYFAGPDVHVVDHHGLTDPLLARLPRDPSQPWRPGHYRRPMPDGYLQTLRTGEVHLTDPAVRALWEDVRWRTRTSVYDPARLRYLVGWTP